MDDITDRCLSRYVLVKTTTICVDLLFKLLKIDTHLVSIYLYIVMLWRPVL